MKTAVALKKEKRQRRRARIRAKITGTNKRPRIALFRSNKAVYAQLIDDEKGRTLAAVSTRGSKADTLSDRAKEAGILLAKKAREQQITTAVFDRGGFMYTGRVKAFADGAREGGLTF